MMKSDLGPDPGHVRCPIRSTPRPEIPASMREPTSGRAGSNQRPPACKAGAFPAELTARLDHYSGNVAALGGAG